MKTSSDQMPPAVLRLARAGLMLAISLLGSCAPSTWDRLDPEYATLLPVSQRDWPPNAILGIWHTQTQPRFAHPSSRYTLQFLPDHTVRWRGDGVEGAYGQWQYQGQGRWNVVWTRNVFLNPLAGQYWLPVTVRYTGRFLLVDAPFNGGAFSGGGVIQNHLVYASARDEAGLQHTVDKRF